MNYAAVTAVSMRSLNRQRANIVFSTLLQDGEVLRPTDVSKRERIFERDGALRWKNRIVGYCVIGQSLEPILERLGGLRNRKTGSRDLQATKLSELLRLYQEEAYILWFDKAESQIRIVLKRNATPVDQLRAWTQALLLAQRWKVSGEVSTHRLPRPRDILASVGGPPLEDLRLTMHEMRETFDTHGAALRDAGWNLDHSALETKPGLRLFIAHNKEV
jgi:hypothetical protein